MDEQNAGYPYNGIELSLQKEGGAVSRCIVDES